MWKSKNKYMALKNKYITLGDGVYLHLVPDGAIVGKRQSQGPKPFTLEYINKTATKILLKCNGTLTAAEIIQNLFKEEGEEYDEVIARQNFLFLEEALKKGHIKAYDGPSPVSLGKTGSLVSVTGTADYFTPVELIAELTYECNFRCRHCYVESSPLRKEFMPTREFLDKLEELHLKGVRVIELTGGEPLLHPDFLEIFEYCASVFELVAVITNGYLINEEIVDKWQKYKHKLIVSVSLHSYSSKFHDWFTCKDGAWKKATEAIQLLANKGIHTVRASMVLTPENWRDMEKTIILAKQLGANLFTYTPVLPFGRGKNLKYNLNISELEELIRYTNKIVSKYGRFIQIVPEEVVEWVGEHGCRAGLKSVVLGPTGNLRPCLMLGDSYISLGNLFYEDMDEIYQKPIISWLDKLKPPSKDICGECKYQLFCWNCYSKAIMKWEELGERCTWAKIYNVDKWIRSPKPL
ncbi:MAG: radical SAM protein [Thermoproteota archaeon]